MLCEHFADVCFSDIHPWRPVFVGRPSSQCKKDIEASAETRDLAAIQRIVGEESVGDFSVALRTGEGDFVVVTSAGFSGAYYDEDRMTLHYSLSNVQTRPLDPLWLDNYLSHKAVLTPPFLTPFRGVKRLGFGWVYSVSASSPKLSGHPLIRDREADAYFTGEGMFGALCESVYRCRDHYGDLSLMLSGGLDSVLIGMAMEECGLPVDAYNIHTELSFDNNKYKAIGVAKLAGWNYADVEGIDGNCWDTVYESMGRDFVNPANPHWSRSPYENSTSLSGQNADALIGINMSKQHLSAVQRAKYVVKNSMLTDPGIHHPAAWIPLINFFNGFSRKSKKYAEADFLRGFLEHQYPYRSDRIHSFVDELEKEFSTLLDVPLNDKMASIFSVHGAHYMQNALTHIQKQRAWDGHLTVLPYNAFPVLRYSVDSKRGFSEALYPKKGIKELIDKRLGSDIHDLYKGVRIPESENSGLVKKEPVNPILKRAWDDSVFSGDDRLLSLLDDTRPESASLREKIFKDFGHIRTAIQSGAIKKKLSHRAYKYINLELILRSADPG